MPIEVRELVIKVTVNQPESGKKQSSAQEPARENKDRERDNLVQHCVEQVFDIIHNKKER